ncbi:hypothetical protein EDD18DRAFT_1344502 [Armillaria luteobubalina]|uniref:Uncharacterized protein n=1 Tax=Armillaria luteobubalina TaxID=153913 RepID=A0AA39UYS5_9AGAR|nr:hypothetical protein EDD18DRAFT_1344502 [Armillaria luteobubalina]
MGAILYVAGVPDVKDDNGHHLNRSVLTAIVVVLLLFILLIVGFTLLWCLRSQRRDENPAVDTTINTTTTTNVVGTAPVTSPRPAYIPLRVYRPRLIPTRPSVV